MQSFTYSSSPCRVVFARGSLKQLPQEIERMNKMKPLLLISRREAAKAEHIQAMLSKRSLPLAGIFHDVVMHTPTDVTARAVTFVDKTAADCLISFGGGSAIGLGKAISIRTGLPHICLPTTYAGSEMTPILGETTGGLKTTRSHVDILPKTVIYDPDLTLNLPTATSITSGINAMAHAIEAMYAQNANPIISLWAKEGLRALVDALPRINDSPGDVDARTRALYGAWLCSMCLGQAGMALHHKLCHVLGGSCELPHAETHSVVLAHALSYNAPSIPHVMDELAEIFPNSKGDALIGLNLFLAQVKAPRNLRRFGMKETDIERVADLAMKSAYWNPRPLDKDGVRELIRRCWAGEEARAHL